MSLVTFIRDYVDVANNSDKLDGYTLSSLAYHVLVLLFTIVKQALTYCFTFQWFRDFAYFSLTPPPLLSNTGGATSSAKLGSDFGAGLLGLAQNPENEPLSHLLAFSDSNFSVGVLFLGFLNGCFSCLQLSAANLVTIQRMLVQGVPAGICSALGTGVGQIFFVGSVLFGFRGFLFPWLALEPLHFVIGVGVTLSVASAIAQDRRTPTLQWSAKSSLFIYAFTSFVLTWCEQATLFQWVGNISFSAEPSFLETSPFLVGNNTLFGSAQQLIQNGSYLFAFFFGNVLGAYLLGFLLQRFFEFILRYKGIAIYYGLIKQANLPLATFIFAFGFGSLPYYGLDYLITKGFGFVPNEDLFQQTLFSPTNLVSKTSQASEAGQGRLEDQLAVLFTLEGERSKSFAVDTTPFDNGQYLKANQKRPQTFEDLNYRGEHLWTNRLSRISNIREQANQTQSSFLGPLFSWMRSFLWGSGPTATNSETIPPSVLPLHPTDVQDVQEEASSLASSYGDKKHARYGVNEKNPVEERTTNGIDQLRKVNRDQQSWQLSSKNEPIDGSQKFIFDNIKLKKKELSPESKQVDNYVKEFNRQFDKGFSNFYDVDPHSLIEVEDQWQEKRIKEKCYTNPIYKFLLNVEIDAFLLRQPNSHWLSTQEEVMLLKRRQLLSNYYDTLALTSQMSTSGALDQLVPKSYANSIYNHQFKGTLKVARRLFSVKRGTPKPNMNAAQSIDNYMDNMEHDKLRQSLYDYDVNHEVDKKRMQVNKTSITNEAGTGTASNAVDNDNVQKSALKKKADFKQTRIIKFDQSLFSKGKNHAQQSLFHEELGVDLNKDHLAVLHNSFPYFAELSKPETLIRPENTFFLEQAESLPLYAGWDEQLRKLVLTNRFQNQALAGYTFSKFPTRSTNLKETDSSMVFTTWPIPNPFGKKINDLKNYDKIESVDYKANPNLDKDMTSEASVSGTGVWDKRNKTKVDKSKSVNFINNDSSVKANGANNVNDTAMNLIKRENRFLFKNPPLETPITNDMVNALLQWQKFIKENKQLSKEDKQAAKERVSFWPENVNSAHWFHEPVDSDIEIDSANQGFQKKQTLLWEFTPPHHGGFIWSGNNWNN